jgi:hypothetical protein
MVIVALRLFTTNLLRLGFAIPTQYGSGGLGMVDHP